MRELARNTQMVCFSRLRSVTEIEDEWGNPTGQYSYDYSDPVAVKLVVSAARGEEETHQFGELLNFHRVLTWFDPSIKMDETTRVWIDQLDVSLPHDYEVVRVARSQNVTSAAVRRVEVSH